MDPGTRDPAEPRAPTRRRRRWSRTEPQAATAGTRRSDSCPESAAVLRRMDPGTRDPAEPRAPTRRRRRWSRTEPQAATAGTRRSDSCPKSAAVLRRTSSSSPGAKSNLPSLAPRGRKISGGQNKDRELLEERFFSSSALQPASQPASLYFRPGTGRRGTPRSCPARRHLFQPPRLPSLARRGSGN